MTRSNIPTPSDPATPAPRALDGLRVIDLSRILAGPYGTQVLADHGAEVIKVEPPQGDDTRAWGPPFDAGGTAAYFNGVNRGKRSIVLDLSTPEGRATLLALLEDADVLVENFRAGTLEKWGIGADDLAARFPRLIHCRITGYGDDGPLGGLPGYDAALQAVTGLMSVNGATDGPPTRLGVPVVDMVTGLNAVIGILMAVNERHRSGRGQRVDSTLFDTGVSLLHPHMANHLQSGQESGRSGNAHPNIAPYDSFSTATGDVFLAVGNDAQFARLCAMLGQPDMATRPEFLTNADRSRNRAALRERLEAAMAGYDAETLAQACIEAGVPCGPVLSVGQVAGHAHTQARQMIVRAGAEGSDGAPSQAFDAEGGLGVGSAIKLGRTPARYGRPAPGFGADEAEILAGLVERSSLASED